MVSKPNPCHSKKVVVASTVSKARGTASSGKELSPLDTIRSAETMSDAEQLDVVLQLATDFLRAEVFGDTGLIDRWQAAASF